MGSLPVSLEMLMRTGTVRLFSSLATVTLTVPEQVGHEGCRAGLVMRIPTIFGFSAAATRASCRVSAVWNPLGRSKALAGNAKAPARRMSFFIARKTYH